MVRVKHRYLLVQILTPTIPPRNPITSTMPSTFNNKFTFSDTAPLPLHIHSPTPDALTAPLLLAYIRRALSDLFGDHGVALAGTSLAIKYWSSATSTFIVRCKRECLRVVWAALTWCVSVPVPDAVMGKGGGGARGGVRKEREVVMRVVRVSGTIRKCEEEAVKRARALCGRVKGVQVAVEAGLLLGSGGAGMDRDDVDMDVDHVDGITDMGQMGDNGMESGTEDEADDDDDDDDD